MACESVSWDQREVFEMMEYGVIGNASILVVSVVLAVAHSFQRQLLNVVSKSYEVMTQHTSLLITLE
jgi:hypothetical protein